MIARPLLATLLLAAGALDAQDRAADTLIPWLLDHREALRDIPFPDVILIATGHRVIRIDAGADAPILHSLGEAIDAALATLNDPGHAVHNVGRVNEASRPVEDALCASINQIPG